MPSSPPSVRPVLAALLTVLLLAAPALASGPLILPFAAVPAAASGPASPASPAAPPVPDEDAPVSTELISVDPASLAPGGTVTAEVAVTNTSSEPLETVSLELRTRTARVTDRDLLAGWQAETAPDTSTPVVAESPETDQLAPGDTATLTVQAPAEDLGYVDEPYYWGTRRISLTVVAGDEPLTGIRSFVVWRPEQAQDQITQSVLLPLANRDPAAAVMEPEEYEQSLNSGRMASLQQLALRGDVDWWLDPALLDPPSLPVEPSEGDGGTDGTAAAEDPSVQPIQEHAPGSRAAGLATALAEGVGERTVLAMPYARADLTGLQASGGDQLAAAATSRAQETWDQAGIPPRALALPVAGQQADADALDAAARAGADAAVLPSSSLRSDVDSSVTPSSVGVYAPEGGDTAPSLPVLAPDPELSSEFSLLTGETDTMQVRQRMLAETATIASEYATAPRHVLISPNPDAALDAGAAGQVLDALSQAPWIQQGSTDALLEAAAPESWTTDARSGTEDLYALGRLGRNDVLASGPGDDGHWEHLDGAEEIPAPDPELIAELESTWNQQDQLASIMADDAGLAPGRLLVLSAASMRWRSSPETAQDRSQEAAARSSDMLSRIVVVPASGYNLISDSAGVPMTVENGLDSPITVRTAVTSDRPLVQVGEQQVVEVPARGQVDLTVPVEAIANGTVELTVGLTDEQGDSLTEPVQVPLTVNPAWENWTTMLVVIAMGLLVVVGVARARRSSSAARAPADRAPEDPVELARSGRSRPDRSVDSGNGATSESDPGTGRDDRPPREPDDPPPSDTDPDPDDSPPPDPDSFPPPHPEEDR